MAELLKLKQIRSGHRTHTKKLIERVSRSKPTDQMTSEASKILLATLTSKETVLEKCNSDILEYLSDEDLIAAEIEESSSFAEQLIEARTKLELNIQFFEKKVRAQVKNEDIQDKSNIDEKEKIQIKLPPISIGEYNGSLLTWGVFWDKFDVAVHSRTDLSIIQKYTYLKSYLVGEAKRAVEGLSSDKENYQNAIDTLIERFGNRQLRISAHMKELQNVKGVKNISDVAGMRNMYDTLEMNINNLKELKVDVTTYGSLLIALIFDRIPQELRIKISLVFGDREWKLDEAMKVFKSELIARERSSVISGTLSSQWIDGAHNDFSTAQSLQISAGMQRRFRSHQGKAAFSNQHDQREDYKKGGASGRCVSCVFCKQQHLSSRCRNITDVNTRYDIVRKENRCYVCLQKSHRSKDCHLKFYSCVRCRRKHNIALCGQSSDDMGKSFGPKVIHNSVAHVDEYGSTVGENSTTESSLSNMKPENEQCSSVAGELLTSQKLSTTNICLERNSDGKRREIALQCALGDVCDPGEKICDRTCVLFDGCSQRTYVKSELRNRLKLRSVRTEKLIIKTFSSREGRLQAMEVVQLCVKGQHGANVYIEALVVPFICSRLNVPPLKAVQHHYEYLRNIEMSESPTNEQEVGILVGLDYYFSFVSGRVRRGPPGFPVAIESVLGWMICGPVQVVDSAGHPTSVVNLIDNEVDVEESGLKSELENFWNTEVLDPDDLLVLQGFRENVRFNGSRYVADLPKKDPDEFIPDHYNIALKRLISLHKNQLDKNLELKEEYYKVFEQYEEENIIEKVHGPGTPGNVNYLPHRPVVRRDKETSKVRPVFDVSARQRGGKSLNDYLHTGPSLLCQIFDIVIRVRLSKIIIIADIRQAFLNIEISDKYKDLLRFLLFDKEDPTKINTYRFNRGCFGVTCLPFILCATIIQHMRYLENREESLIPLIEQFLRDLYMDDVTTAVNGVDEGMTFYNFARKAMKEAGLELRKWDSSSEELRKYMHCIDEGKDLKRILGIPWNREDEFVFDFSELAEESLKLPVTKRNIASVGAKFFDPAGWISPIVVVAKMHFQKACKEKRGWDEKLSEGLEKGWLNYLKQLSHIKCIRIPRYIFPSITETVSSVQLHGYCDGSEQAYGAVVYACARSTSCLIAAKSKVVPIKKISIPRIELLSCVLLAELMKSVRKLLRGVVVVEKLYLWSDSEVALAWIKGKDKSKWKSWVQRRVKKIQDRTDPNNWSYVHTSINPADISTRESSGMKIGENNMWWFGPSLPHKAPVSSVIPVQVNLVNLEMEKEEVVSQVNADSAICIGKCIDVERFSSLQKLLRVTAFVLRFIDAAKAKDRQVGEVTTEETEIALELWIKYEQAGIASDSKFKNMTKQLSLFNDKKGILRLKGRLENSHLSYDAKHPILLNRCSHFTRLIILHAHGKVKHMRTKSTLNEIRSRYWICSGKQTVNSVIKSCVHCKGVNGKTLIGPPPPDLPEYRVSYEFAYSNIGIDFAGPLYVRDAYSTDSIMHKAYICLITCAATRNVHVELCTDMSTPALIRCLKRFIGRRGKFNLAVSDNFKSFLSKELKSFLTNENISWKFILPKSPWWGAFYERLIRVIKEALKKCLGNAKLTYEELETVLVEVETVINCRPLTYLYEEVGEALTPSHLAIGRRLISEVSWVESTNSAENSHESLGARYKYLQTILDHYWKRFSTEYLQELRQHHLEANKGNYDQLCKMLLGDVVLIKDDVFKRNLWKKGKVEKLIYGNDGKVRGAMLKIVNAGKASYIQRPVQKLIPLEVQKASAIHAPISSPSNQMDATTPPFSPNSDSGSNDAISSPPDISSRGRNRLKTNRFQAT